MADNGGAVPPVPPLVLPALPFGSIIGGWAWAGQRRRADGAVIGRSSEKA
jgi:hypothetical protein